MPQSMSNTKGDKLSDIYTLTTACNHEQKHTTIYHNGTIPTHNLSCTNYMNAHVKSVYSHSINFLLLLNVRETRETVSTAYSLNLALASNLQTLLRRIYTNRSAA